MITYDKDEERLVIPASINYESLNIYNQAYTKGYQSGYTDGLNSCKIDYSKEYLTLEAITSGYFLLQSTSSAFTQTIQYRKNGGNWISITSKTGGVSKNNRHFSVNEGDIIELRGDNDAYSSGDRETVRQMHTEIKTTFSFNLYGNIMSLIDSTGYTTLDHFSSGNVFYSFFFNQQIIDASNLILPVKTLTNECYSRMFLNCMNMTYPPALPATELAPFCYNNLFANCDSLVRAPELKVKTLVEGCYAGMFQGCYNLTYIKCLAEDISSDSCTMIWLSGVSPTGTFETPSTTSWTTGTSGIPEGWTRVDA